MVYCCISMAILSMIATLVTVFLMTNSSTSCNFNPLLNRSCEVTDLGTFLLHVFPCPILMLFRAMIVTHNVPIILCFTVSMSFSSLYLTLFVLTNRYTYIMMLAENLNTSKGLTLYIIEILPKKGIG